MVKSLALALLSLVATVAHSQTVAGRVTDGTSLQPVAGVVVSALDSSRTVLARAVTDLGTGYRLLLPAGAVRLQFRRIGFSPREVALRDSVAGRIDVTMERLPTRLPPVKATIAAQCDAAPDRNDALALWEEARSGMLTSMVARESKSAFISVLLYEFPIENGKEMPRHVRRVEFSSSSPAFAAGSDPAALAKKGYLAQNLFGASFLAPDDQVLFDQTFLETHCFSFETPAAGDDSTVGLRFEPGKGRKVVDVAGVVWMRKNPLDLKSVEFKYVNVDRNQQKANPGGSIRFRQMPNGITMIQEWSIRSATNYRSRKGNEIALTESGAVIELMNWPDVPPFVAPLGSISGVVLDKFTGNPLVNTPIRLDATPFVGRTDSTGAFRFVDVLPGTYAVDIGDPRLDYFGAAPPLLDPVVVKPGDNGSLTLKAEGPMAAAVRGCDEKADARFVVPKVIGGPYTVLGWFTSRGRELGFRAEIMPVGAVAGAAPFVLKGRSDRSGRFRVCGLPAGTVSIIPDDREFSPASGLTVGPLDPYRLVPLGTRQAPPSP